MSSQNQNNPGHRPLTCEEYRTLVKAADEQSLRNGFTVFLIGYTGLQTGEAAHFSPEWFDPTDQTVTVPED